MGNFSPKELKCPSNTGGAELKQILGLHIFGLNDLVQKEVMYSLVQHQRNTVNMYFLDDFQYIYNAKFCDSFLTPMSMLFDKMYATCKIPEQWKVSKIIPTHLNDH